MTWAFRPRCPRCKERRFGRSHRHGIVERAISILVVPYRCDECDSRFFGYRGWAWNSVRRKTEPRDGLGLHGFGLTVSIAVILVSAWSVVHSSQKRQTALVRTDRTVRSEAVEPAGNGATPPEVTKAARKPALALRNRSLAAEADPARARRARLRPTGPVGDVHLRSRNSVVIVASNQAAAQAFATRSRRLEDLIHGGTLFSISNGTAAVVEEQRGGISRVRILQGAMAGKQGWVPDAEISSK